MSEWYYSKDGAQLGPVTETELKNLFAAGTLDAATVLVWKSGMGDWLPAAQIPALAGPPAGTNPYAAPSSGFAPVVEMATPLGEIQPGSESIDAMACMKRAIDLTVRHIGPVLLSVLIVFGASFTISMIFSTIDTAVKISFQNSAEPPMALFIGISVVTNLVSQAVSIFLGLGLIRFMLNLVSGREASLGQIFGEGRIFLRTVLASLLFYLGCGLVIGLIAVPGVLLYPSMGWVVIVPLALIAIVVMLVLWTRFGFFMHAIVDRDCGVLDCFSYSSSITTNNRMNLALLYFLGIVAGILGVLALCVGLLFAYPVILLSWSVAYRWLQYGHRAAMDHPGTTTPMLAPQQG
jgi:uncharacterized membrane protein